ncbi:hypothetical protein HG421_19960 [Xanthomonas campestris pv. badrii]|uniref:Uncharacterized protein n=1 Tax=Xanthomonas campestris pv. badrii TaxID=149696 RepID=A0A7Z2VDP2_XANCA|nr:hypothetical protein [Xanthomonas campestris]QJD69739.1 hypothetical protein HG421_19960 [Xanthomonas campestris pv. badrii]
MELGRLSPTAALIAAIRGQSTRGGRAIVQADTADRKKDVTSAGQIRSTDQLERQLLEIVRDVRHDDKAELRRVRPLLIRQVLLWEFGQAFREHPEWAPIMQRIEAALEAADPDGQGFAGLVRSMQRKS